MDPSAFLFNLDCNFIFPVINARITIKNSMNDGPSFGANMSLKFGTPFNGFNSTSLSGDDDKSFFIPSINGDSALTDRKENFALVEFECYKVILHRTI
jgi:hypothetical protein